MIEDHRIIDIAYSSSTVASRKSLTKGLCRNELEIKNGFICIAKIFYVISILGKNIGEYFEPCKYKNNVCPYGEYKLKNMKTNK